MYNALFHIKLKQARIQMNMSQKELAEWMMLSSHSIISQYETGKLKNLSDEYVDFLLTNKFDLNSLFDNSIQNIQRIKENNNSELENTKAIIAEREKKIVELEANVKMLQEMLLGKDQVAEHQRSA
jgi:transcriptional regulator with XRE-family HTH domain